MKVALHFRKVTLPEEYFEHNISWVRSLSGLMHTNDNDSAMSQIHKIHEK